MPEPVSFFNIFLSSPGDVPQERDDAEAVICEINESGEFANHFLLKLYRWDDKKVVLPMPVTEIPQRSVDIYMTRPSECDLVVVLFWSRMGSPLVMDEREYLSGTHYEYSEALQGYQQIGKPTVWLYRCTEEPSLKLSDPKRDLKIKQFDLVQQFFKQFHDAEGRPTAGVNEYAVHPDFKALFKGQLVTYLRHLRDHPRTLTAPTITPSRPKFTGVPYRGLNALDEEDAAIFFGRDRETFDVLSRVEARHLVFVLGASGSGKSSLVAAGVLPKLRERGWRIIRCVPGDDPFYNLALALVSQLPEMGVKATAFLSEARQLAETLRQSPGNLAQQIALTLPRQRVLLFIDQFEELFTLADKNPQIRNDQRDDVSLLMQAVHQATDGLTILLTMRADFYGIALPYFETLKEEAYGLTRPSVFALYDLITRPAELAGLTLDDGLAQHIVEAVGGESGALALVAYLMEALYLSARQRGDTCLSWTDYQALGGVKGAINTLAGQAYATLPFEEAVRQRAMRAVFRELIALTEEDGQLIPTRRRAPLSLFAADTVEAQFIETFVNARLLVRDSASVEVAHEAILLHWGQLEAWIGKIKGDLALLRQYERDAKTWADRGKDTPPPTHEALVFLYDALENLDIDRETLAEPLRSYTEPEAARLLRELTNLPHKPEVEIRRMEIGDRLVAIGDPREGIGVKDGVPDILWLSMTVLPDPVTIKTDENEIGPVMIKPFFIAKYQVTYAQYRAFVEAEDGFRDDRWWQGMPEQYQKQELASQRTKNGNNPRDSVSWYQSVAFARWLDAKYRELGLFERLLPSPQTPLPIAPSALGEGLQNMVLKGEYRAKASEVLVQIARELRQRETGAEDLLWECLRDRRLADLKFRRQHPVANTTYVVDFFCYEYRLVVELDGGIHDNQREADANRQAELEALGFRVLRIPNDMLYSALEDVLTLIAQMTLDDSPLLAAQRRSGEGPGVRAEDWQIRLPTEWEWQWAAQGGLGAKAYPWGGWKPGFANTTESGLGRAIAVGMYPHGVADCGALDMAGNLYDWCQNDKEDYHIVDGYNNGRSKVLRGGSFGNFQSNAACAYRNGNAPSYGSHGDGLRLVLAPPISAL